MLYIQCLTIFVISYTAKLIVIVSFVCNGVPCRFMFVHLMHWPEGLQPPGPVCLHLANIHRGFSSKVAFAGGDKNWNSIESYKSLIH